MHPNHSEFNTTTSTTSGGAGGGLSPAAGPVTCRREEALREQQRRSAWTCRRQLETLLHTCRMWHSQVILVRVSAHPPPFCSDHGSFLISSMSSLWVSPQISIFSHLRLLAGWLLSFPGPSSLSISLSSSLSPQWSSSGTKVFARSAKGNSSVAPLLSADRLFTPCLPIFAK